jgi:DNA repair protein RecN (Recombination protein N)
MLRLLEVRNLALMDNLSFYPGGGLNCLSGETGAGKSMLIGAIELLLGERATPDCIRAGCEEAFIQAVFSPPSGLFDGDDPADGGGGELVLAREIRRCGPNICRVNGRVQPLARLREAGRRLIDLHGQNSQQSLLSLKTQRELLDAYGGPDVAAPLARATGLWREKSRLLKVIDQLGGDGAEAARRLDFLRFQLAEIEGAGLSPGEEEELSNEQKRLANARQLLERAALAYTVLCEGRRDDSVMDRLGGVEKELAAAAALDKTLEEAVSQVAAAMAQLHEAARQLRDYQDTVSVDEGRLAEVTERLEQYRRMKKKYGPRVDDVLVLAESLKQELASLSGWERQREEAASRLAKITQELAQAAADLSEARKTAAGRLSRQITEALQDLALRGALLTVRVEDSGSIASYGRDQVSFMFSANPGEPELTLERAASGGEMARLALAVKSVLAAQDNIPTLIFDEIDAGIGGVTVKSVADRLKNLSRHRQAICVTHQPLIAAAADLHFSIHKELSAGRTVTRLSQLDAGGREAELARMLGGAEGDSTVLAHARSMLNQFKVLP